MRVPRSTAAVIWAQADAPSFSRMAAATSPCCRTWSLKRTLDTRFGRIANDAISTAKISQKLRKTFSPIPRTSLSRGGKRIDVAYASDRLDPFLVAGAQAELATQFADVHIDAAVKRIEAASQHSLGNGLSRHGLTR